MCGRATSFADTLTDTDPVTISEWDNLIASEQSVTAEPFDPQP